QGHGRRMIAVKIPPPAPLAAGRPAISTPREIAVGGRAGAGRRPPSGATAALASLGCGSQPTAQVGATRSSGASERLFRLAVPVAPAGLALPLRLAVRAPRQA